MSDTRAIGTYMYLFYRLVEVVHVFGDGRMVVIRDGVRIVIPS